MAGIPCRMDFTLITKNANNRFQGTLHKVSGPLNRDVVHEEMKEIGKAFFRSRWLLAGILLHITGLIIICLFLDFDILFELCWAHGPGGPTPLMDALVWTLKLALPAGCACYGMALWTAFKKGNAQPTDRQVFSESAPSASSEKPSS